MAQADKPVRGKDSPATRKAKSAAAKAASTARERATRRVAATREKRPLGGFMDFVREQGVIGLAIGLALGTQVKSLVDQIVASFINPLVGLVLPGQGDLTKKTFALTVGEKTATFTYGAFLNMLISFIAVAAVIYFVVKGLNLDKIDKKKE
jgi:large conductance mechanosensitive channel